MIQTMLFSDYEFFYRLKRQRIANDFIQNYKEIAVDIFTSG